MSKCCNSHPKGENENLASQAPLDAWGIIRYPIQSCTQKPNMYTNILRSELIELLSFIEQFILVITTIAGLIPGSVPTHDSFSFH